MTTDLEDLKVMGAHALHDRPTAPVAVRRIARNWHLVLLSWLLLFLIVPFDVTYPAVGVKSSWGMGVNVAVAQHMVFGRDIVFTYGPYAAVSTRLYHPDLVWLTLGGGLVLAVAYIVAALVLLRSAPRWVAVALSIALALGLASVDSLSLIYPLVAVVAVHRLARDAEPGELGWGDRSRLAVLAFPFALLPLVKTSSVPAVLVGVVAVLLLLALRRHRLEAATLWLVPAVGIFFLWLAASQPLGGLYDYFVTSLPIILGYTQAMSQQGDATQAMQVSFALALAILVMLLGSALVLTERLVIAAVMTATSLLTFKAAFVRQDVHVLIVIFPLIIVAAVAAAYCRRRPWRVLVVVICLAVALPLPFDYALPGQDSTSTTIVRAFTAGPAALAQRIVDPGHFDQRYDRVLAHIRRKDRVPHVAPGSDVDLYSHLQSSLLAQPGVLWNPGPVFQSYSAYTPSLAKLNLDHLQGPSAPEEVLLTIHAIDHRLPALEDGALWLTLLENYRITDCDLQRKFLVMHRRHRSITIPETRSSVTLHGTLGHRLSLPRNSPGWLARFDVRPTLQGRLRELLWKTSPMSITVTLRNGHQRRFRFIPEMGRTQFLLSPLVRTPWQMAGLLSTPACVAGATVPRRVRSIRLDSDGPTGEWNRDYTVELKAVGLPTAAATASRPEPPAPPTR